MQRWGVHFVFVTSSFLWPARARLVLADVGVRHGAARELHGLLEVRALDAGHGVRCETPKTLNPHEKP